MRFFFKRFAAKRRSEKEDDTLRFELKGYGQRREQGKKRKETVSRGGGQGKVRSTVAVAALTKKRYTFP